MTRYFLKIKNQGVLLVYPTGINFITLQFKINFMKKIYVIAFLIVASITVGLNAQNPLHLGGRQLNLGVGKSDWGIPIVAGVDFGVHPDFSVGLQASYSSFTETWDSTDFHRLVFALNAVGNYHFKRILKMSEKWDLYAGLNVGFYFWSKPKNYYGDNTSEMAIGLQIGGRYYFTDKIGVNLELASGSSISAAKLGISYLFK